MKREQVVFILGGGIVEDNGVWRTTTFTEFGDKFGALGDRLRVEAAVVLYQVQPDTTLLVTSGSKGQLRDHPTAPTVATVVAGELQDFGVPIAAIMLDEESGNSFQQLCALRQMAEASNWQDIKVLTNQWHIHRVQTMVNVTESLKDCFLKRNVAFLSAEKVLIEADSAKWREPIEAAYQSEAMRLRVQKEAQGVKDLLSGVYRLK